ITYFNVNRHINPTNVCVAACKLCAFGRKKGDPAGYTMALEEAWETAASGYSEAVTEFHIVGGLHPDLPLEYFLDLVRGLKQRFPKVHIKAFTMVEVAFLARRAKLTIEQTLLKLRDAGVDSMPGGGADIFSSRARCRMPPADSRPSFRWPSTRKTLRSTICRSPQASPTFARLP